MGWNNGSIAFPELQYLSLIMKVYEDGYNTNDLERCLAEIQYSLEPMPESRYSARELAVTDCVLLNKHQLRIEVHCCSFTVLELPEATSASSADAIP